jgi:medium-chain acyl-[acyl-carrier-protein] hydrolase
MLVPSLWAEARSRVVLESMSRGVPVVSSDLGGLPEAHLGVDYALPVNPIRHYRQAVDTNMVPVAEVPPQDIEPWVKTVERIVNDREHWSALAQQSRAKALEYAANLDVSPFESLLTEIARRPKKSAPVAISPMSEEKRKLLALRLKQKAARKPEWFSGLGDMQSCGRVLFCFPYAGGGTMVYRAWRHALPDTAVIAIRLPGRESRLGEPPIGSMAILVETLGMEILPHLRQPFAFLGHSMGAIVAFELTRWLRSNGHALPKALHVSAARAPQYRLHHKPDPEPDEQSFVNELRRLEGMPREILDNPELMRIALPALRADAALYRQYVYHRTSRWHCQSTPMAECQIRIFNGNILKSGASKPLRNSRYNNSRAVIFISTRRNPCFWNRCAQNLSASSGWDNCIGLGGFSWNFALRFDQLAR